MSASSLRVADPLPARLPRLERDAIHVYALELDGSAASEPRVLSATEQRAARFARPQLQRRYRRAHAALECLLAHALGRALEPDEIAQGEHGKPWLPSAPGLHFNLAHSGELALVALSQRGPIGVDVERIEARASLLELAERFFSARESAALRALPEQERTVAFFRCWTRKEAFVKAVGAGLSMGLASFDVAIDARGDPASAGEAADSLLLRVADPELAARGFALVALELDQAHAGALCWSGGGAQLRAWRGTALELCALAQRA